jgi:hypothetical protein
MAALVDGQATAIQEQGLKAHAQACVPCNRNLRQLRAGSAAYAGLPLSQAPNLLAAVSGGAGLVAVSSLGGGGVSALLALIVQAKLGLLVLLASAMIGAASFVVDDGPSGPNGIKSTEPVSSLVGQDASESPGPLQIDMIGASSSEPPIIAGAGNPTATDSGLNALDGDPPKGFSSTVATISTVTAGGSEEVAAVGLGVSLGVDQPIALGVTAEVRANDLAAASVTASSTLDLQNGSATAAVTASLGLPLADAATSIDAGTAVLDGQLGHVAIGVQPIIPPLPLPALPGLR